MPAASAPDLDPSPGPRPDPPPRPGWYPDPRELDAPEPEPGYRWWDGTGWTGWLADTPHAPAPRGTAPRVEPRAQSSTPRSPRWLVAVLVLTCLLLGLTALSIHGRSLPDPVPQATTPADLGTPQRVIERWGPKGRTVVIGEKLTLSMAKQSVADTSVTQVPGMWEHCMVTSIEQRPDEKQSTQLVLGSLDPALVVPGDSAATAARAYQQAQSKLTAKVPLDWGTPRIEPWPGIPGASRLEAQVRYRSDDPELVAEDFTMLVLPWQNGTVSGMGSWTSLVPTDATPEVRESLRAAEAAIRLLG